MMLALVLVLMTLIVLATVIAPLVRTVRAPPERARFDRAVYRDQLKELDRDAARGLVAPGDSRAARLEIERRLLATEASPPLPAASINGSPWLAGLLALLVATGAGALYLRLGAPEVADQPFADRAAERALDASNGHLDLDKTAADLGEKLKANPQDADAWLLFARTEAALDQWQKSADAFRHAMALTNSRPDIAAAYGEMLVLAADGVVTPQARDAFAASLARDASNVAARYYLGLVKAQQGDTKGALDDWQKLANEQPAASPMRRELQQKLTELATTAGLSVPAVDPPASPAGPDAAAVAAAQQMDPAQRDAMIRGMVAKLAVDLDAHPDDLQGWLRLARSYGVLGDSDKAADAYEHAARLKPDDGSIPLAEAELLLGSKPIDQPFSQRALDALHRAAERQPDAPSVLWYSGMVAAKDQDFATAKADWTKLLPALPADSAEHKMVAAALDAIKGR
jgi:cytochrome c-type biogenesis protein CcmH